MKTIRIIPLTVLLILFVAPITHAQTDSTTSIYVDSIAQFDRPVTDHVVEGHPVTYFIRFTHNFPANATGITNGFRIWTEANGVITGNSYPYFKPDYPLKYSYWWIPSIDWTNLYWDGGIFASHYPGIIDTFKFAAFKLFGSGLPPGFDGLAWYIHVLPEVAGDTLCIDSSFAPPGASWLWSTSAGAIVPDWGGPYCLPVVPCCLGSQGNLDISSGPGPQADITDLTMLVSYIFPPHNPLLCDGVGNIDGLSSGGVPIDIVDLTLFVDYLFFGGAPPAACNEP